MFQKKAISLQSWKFGQISRKEKNYFIKNGSIRHSRFLSKPLKKRNIKWTFSLTGAHSHSLCVQRYRLSTCKANFAFRSRDHESRLSKIAQTMESLLLDSSSRQVRVMLTGMKGAGKTCFRQALFHEMGDERLKEKFNELERKRQKSDGIARTVITLNDRFVARINLHIEKI